MKLGPGLDLIETIPFKNLVDVYLVNGMRVARKWPGKPHQPRTAKQKAHWAKIRRMNKVFHDCGGWYVTLMKQFNTPLGYSWYDMAMHGLWHNWYMLEYAEVKEPCTIKGYWSWTDSEHTSKTYGLVIKSSGPGSHRPMLGGVVWNDNTSGRVDPIRWIQSGWKCYRGKKRKPYFIVDLKQFEHRLPFEWIAYEFETKKPLYTGAQKPINCLIGKWTTHNNTTNFVPFTPMLYVSEYSFREWPA